MPMKLDGVSLPGNNFYQLSCGADRAVICSSPAINRQRKTGGPRDVAALTVTFLRSSLTRRRAEIPTRFRKGWP